jgi:periplasmic protein TonB
MHYARPFLVQALVLSLILHAAVMFLKLQSDAPKQQPARMELKVRLPEPRLADPLPMPAEQPRLMLPVPPRNANAVAPAGKRPPVSGPAQPLTGEAALKAAEQLARELPYPPEAVERGLQGEALVLLFLDPSGNVIAARLESSSGHAVLDEAALRAARQLRTLPDSAPREALLPVRFRLR